MNGDVAGAQSSISTTNGTTSDTDEASRTPLRCLLATDKTAPQTKTSTESFWHATGMDVDVAGATSTNK